MERLGSIAANDPGVCEVSYKKGANLKKAIDGVAHEGE